MGRDLGYQIRRQFIEVKETQRAHAAEVEKLEAALRHRELQLGEQNNRISQLEAQLKDAEEVIRLVEEYRRLNEVGVGSQLEVANAYAAMARAQIAYRNTYEGVHPVVNKGDE